MSTKDYKLITVCLNIKDCTLHSTRAVWISIFYSFGYNSQNTIDLYGWSGLCQLRQLLLNALFLICGAYRISYAPQCRRTVSY